MIHMNFWHANYVLTIIRNNKMKTFIKTFLIICLSFIFYSTTTDILSEYNVPIAASSAFATNLYHDGFNDLLIGHHTAWGSTNPTISIMKNMSFGTFEITDTSKVFCGYQDNIFAVDVNNDGWPEVVTLAAYNYSGGTLERYIRIYSNNQGTFNDSIYNDYDLNTRKTIDNINFGDIDGDGFVDLVYSSNSGLFWGVLYNDGNGIFYAPEVHHVTNYYPTGIAIGDLNNDGRDDIVICGQIIDVYFSYPSGFQRLQLSANGFAGYVAISDFNQDGYKDILGNAGFGSTVLVVYKNNGNSTFQRMPDFIFQPPCQQFFVTDFNNDGLPDVIFQKSDLTGYILWYNQGDFQLANSQVISVLWYGEPSRNFYCADLDNNGFNDIITVRFDYYKLSDNIDIRFNDGQGHFVPDPIVGIHDRSTVSKLDLKNYPNPFQDETVFTYYLNETAFTEISIYDLWGKFVTCLINQKLEGGSHYTKWRGLDNGDQPCKPGAYVAYLKVNGNVCNSIKLIKLN
jgi:hypothetical protein